MTSKAKVAISSLTGPLAAVLVYSDPAGRVMPTTSGPLRFFIADAISENAVMEGSYSISQVVQLNAVTP